MGNAEENLEWIRGLSLQLYKLKQALLNLELGLEMLERAVRRQEMREIEGREEDES